MVCICRCSLLFVSVRYLKYYCKSSLSWGEDGSGDNVVLPSPLPAVEEDWFEEVLFVIDCDDS